MVRIRTRLERLEVAQVAPGGGVVFEKWDGSGFEYKGRVYPGLEAVPVKGGVLLAPEQAPSVEEWAESAREHYNGQGQA